MTLLLFLIVDKLNKNLKSLSTTFYRRKSPQFVEIFVVDNLDLIFINFVCAVQWQCKLRQSSNKMKINEKNLSLFANSRGSDKEGE